MKLFRKLFRLVPSVLLLALAAAAQPAPQPAAPAFPDGRLHAYFAQAQVPAPAAEEHRLTAAEAKELFRSVDDILKFASDRTGLPILHSVKKKLATREEVAKYIENQLKEQGNGERFDRTALSLKKLGLLPRDFNLRTYMLGLYKEQVEGWYDAHNKTVYLLDWVEPDLQKTVMAHELVHALQDQSFHLEKWLNVGKDSGDDTAQLALDEQRLARQAVVEGQAMIVLYDYQLAPVGQTVESAPDLVDSMKSSALDEDSTSMYAQAPFFLREAMLFPYSYGMDFIRDVLVKRGKQAAFAGVLEHPPLDTRQIMEPSTYLGAQLQPELKVAPLENVLGPDWRRQDLSGIGEIDLYVILRQWASKAIAAKLSPAWRSGYYAAFSNKKSPKDSPQPLALVLNFATPEAANQFASVYASSLAQRYKSVEPAAATGAASATGGPVAGPYPPNVAAETASTPHEWNTEEGFVRLYIDGATVTAFESFIPAEAAKLHAALIPVVTTTLAPQ